MSGERPFTGGRFAVVVDGSEMLGFVKKVSGGIIKGEVAVHNLGPENVQKKHLATITHEPFILEVGMCMSAGFYEWIRASFDKGHISKTGEFIACDFDYKAMRAREFIDAHIAEVTIPALDGSSKEPAYMTIKLDPEKIHYKPGDGSQVEGKIDPPAKKWLSSDFRFELGDLPCNRVTKIDSFTWKQNVVEGGRVRDAKATVIEVPNLKVTISMADVEAWEDWHQSFVIDGKRSDDDDELTGSITFLDPSLTKELAEIQLLHVGLISLDTTGPEANQEEVPRFTVELYVEEMKFEYKG